MTSPHAHPPTEPDTLSCDFLDEVVFTLDDFVEAGRIAWLELHLGIAADVDLAELHRMIAELIRSTSEREIELGGMGLVLDREASEIAASGLRLVLRPGDPSSGSINWRRRLGRLPVHRLTISNRSQDCSIRFNHRFKRYGMHERH